MSKFRYHDASLRVDDVDVLRTGKKLGEFVKQLIASNTAESLACWQPDKWHVEAAKLFGSTSLHAAQAEGHRNTVGRKFQSPKELAQERRIQWMAEVPSSIEYVPDIFPADFCEAFSPRWRSQAADSFNRWDIAISSGLGPNAIAVVGKGRNVLVDSVCRNAFLGHVIDFSQPDAIRQLDLLEQQDNGYMGSTTGFMHLHRVHDPASIVARCLEFAKRQARSLIVFSLDRKALPLLTEPSVGAGNFNEVRIHDLDLLPKELFWTRVVRPQPKANPLPYA